MGSADSLWKALYEGAWWFDETPGERPLGRFFLLGNQKEGYRRLTALENGRLPSDPASASSGSLTLMPFGWRSMAGTGQISPILSKLFSESELRNLSNTAAINPDTARAHRLADHCRAVVETESGSTQIQIRFDETVMPGVIQAAVGPDPAGLALPRRATERNVLSLCRLDEDCAWRVTRAKVREA
jgi:hypothetical protein